MEDEENFDELISKLDSLGINTKDIRGTIWRAVQQEVSLKAISFHDQKARIVLDIGLDDSYRTSLFNYSVYYPISEEKSHVQTFGTDVPLSDAKKLLQLRITKHIEEPLSAFEPMSRKEVIQELNTLNKNVMNTQNLELLKKNLLNLGFGEDSKLNQSLQDKIEAKEAEFILQTENVFDRKNVDYDLHFKAGDSQEMYFFNKYDAHVYNETPEKDVKQTFYINKGNGVTAKEAFNLMQGRSVYKQLFNAEGQRYHAWLTLDDKNLTESGNMKIKQYHENYGFDIEKVISDKGIHQMKYPEEKNSLLYSLKKGNITYISLTKDGESQSYHISANPKFKTVDLYDAFCKKIKREELLQPEQKPVKSVKQKEQQKEELPAKKQSRKKGMTV